MTNNQVMANKPVLSIIIISYNTCKITQNCLESIFKWPTDRFEIIVIDNNSTDQSAVMLRAFQQKYSNSTLIENKHNTGFAKANNMAAKQTNGHYILFLNSDIIVLNDAINKLLNYYLENENNIHFLGGKLLSKDLTPQPSCGPFYSLPVVFGALFLKGDYWGLTRYSPNKTQAVDWVSGACILTTKDYFNKINGFDEKIFMYMDEIDLFYRAKKIGLKVFFYPHAEFIHLASASSQGKTYPILQVYKGFLYFYHKHFNNKLSLFLLRFMLKLKALLALCIGKIINNQYLLKTYGEAYKSVDMDG